MYEAIRGAFPHTIDALRRAGIPPRDAAAVIMSARYGDRIGARNAADRDRARDIIKRAVASRQRLHAEH